MRIWLKKTTCFPLDVQAENAFYKGYEKKQIPAIKGHAPKLVNKASTTAEHIAKVQVWLDRKRCEQVEARRLLRVVPKRGSLEKIQRNAVLISQAEEWLAIQRVKAENSKSKL